MSIKGTPTPPAPASLRFPLMMYWSEEISEKWNTHKSLSKPSEKVLGEHR